MDTNTTTITQSTKINKITKSKKRNKFIDFHCHIINGVDDGAKDLKQSLTELIYASRMGMNDIICTPHISYGHKNKLMNIEKKFEVLKEYAKILDINLYLGNEILYNQEIVELLRKKKISSLNNSKYLLVEFKRSESRPFEDILTSLGDLVDAGYIVILAHPEFYPNYNKIEYMKKLKEEGILLQLDATSMIKTSKNIKAYKFARKLLKAKLIDFVCSDNHCTKTRNYLMYKKGYRAIRRYCNKHYVKDIFYNNAKEILNNN